MRFPGTKKGRAVQEIQQDEKHVETAKHEDGDVEAAAVGPAMEEIDPEIEKRVRWKLDTHLIPLVSALYLLAFLDRSNIGYVVVSQVQE